MEDVLHRLAAALDVAAPGVDEIDTLLEVAREVAHTAERRSAPLSTFLVGVAVGRGSTLDAACAAVRAAVSPPGT